IRARSLNRSPGVAMSTPPDCPEVHDWQALLEAGLPPERRVGIERHLESCPTRQGRLDPAAGLGEALRGVAREIGGPTLAAADPTLSACVERLAESRPGDRSAPPELIDLYFLGATDRADLLGLLGAYEVQEVIGQGGMGVVLRAFDQALQRLV